jgi:hypothetical protein
MHATFQLVVSSTSSLSFPRYSLLLAITEEYSTFNSNMFLIQTAFHSLEKLDSQTSSKQMNVYNFNWTVKTFIHPSIRGN